MNRYHIHITEEDDWYVLQAQEDPRVHSQARTLDEAVLMIRDVLACLELPSAEIQLVIPPTLTVDDARTSGRLDPGYQTLDAPSSAGDPRSGVMS